MDILISSNLERLVFELSDRNTELTAERMTELKNSGKYTISSSEKKILDSEFFANYCDEQECMETIADYFEEYGYVLDPHTAVAINVTESYKCFAKSNTPTVVLSTASPYKFASSVYTALTKCKAPEGYEALTALSDLTSTPISTPLAGLDKRTVRFDRVCGPEEMAADMFDHLND
jgi:threonine synthase